MNRLLSALPVLLVMAACSGEEPAQPAAPAQPATPVESPQPIPEPVAAEPSADANAEAATSFDRTLEYNGISFHVLTTGDGSIRTLQITPAGLEIDNAPVTREIDGAVTGAEVDDLNEDGSPEVYVYTNSAGSGSYGTLVAYATNNRKSMTGIYEPPLDQTPGATEGYMGHDEFAVVETTLVRRFPVYAAGDTNAKPTGGTRQLQYKLEAGEAGWILRMDRMIEY